MSGHILVTGGAGFIGSHTCVELTLAGYEVTVVDNLCNSSRESLRRVGEITGSEPRFIQLDLRDEKLLDGVFDQSRFDAVIHFAGLKAVGESTEVPLRYYHNNVAGTLVLLDAMQRHGVRDLVFSSSCTVYGDPESVPIREDAPLHATNPYGQTKLVIERILQDLSASEPDWHVVLLRYFNPVGAHPSGRIGEDPRGIPNNLLPYVMQVAVGQHPHVRVFGNDWPTRDGTGVRDYIHVVDLAQGHLAALDYLPRVLNCEALNLGTGHGASVLEVIEAARAATAREIPYEFTARRPGDIAEAYADPAVAERALGWRATRTLQDSCRDAWRWQQANPDGYAQE